MKSLLVMLAVFLAVTTMSAKARAWDGPELWYQSAVGGPNGAPGPGGGGIIGTGGATDHNITCAHCHVKGAAGYGSIGLNVTFTPPIAATYKRGQTYQVAVALTGEHLGKGACGPYMKNINGFAASFEDEAGENAGVLKATNGSSSSCPPTIAKNYAGETYTYNDCHAIMGERENGTSWTFEWTAPADSKTVTLYYGAVDGDCMMTSNNDDVKVGTMKLGAGTTVLVVPEDRGGAGRALAFAGLVPFFALVSAARRRRRAPT